MATVPSRLPTTYSPGCGGQAATVDACADLFEDPMADCIPPTLAFLNTKEIIDSIYVSLDDDKVETAVRNCLRLARAAGDHFYAVVFLRQLCHDRDEFFAA